MRTIIINNEEREAIRESILKDTLPTDIAGEIVMNKTPLSNNPSIPDIFDKPYLLKILSSSFEEAKDALREIGDIDDVEETDVEGVLAHLILKCKELEKPYRNELEKICFNYVLDFFSVPEETVQLTISLTDEVDLGRPSIKLDPEDGDDTLELNDLNDALSIKDEVYKRRLLDAICIGAGIKISSDIDTYADEINAIDESLCDLYKKIIALNNYLLCIKSLELTDENKMQIGTVELSLGTEDDKVKIEAQGLIFPVLLSETIRGFMELFCSHGLPSERERAMAVLGKADFLKAEPWDMRFGPTLWALLSNSFNDIESTDLPYLLKRISTLETDRFNFLMKEVFAKTKKGRNIMSFLCSKAKDDAEYDKFVDRMDKMRKDKGIITDDYIHEDEL